MGFIKLYPLQEQEDNSDYFGRGNPARCQAIGSYSAPEYYLNCDEIAAFEECPLYLISEAEPNALVNGLRVRLKSGQSFILADDPDEDGEAFVDLLARAMRGEVVEMPFSRYLAYLTRQKLI